MEWILLIIVFDLNGAAIAPQKIIHKAYSTSEACNAAGVNFRSIVAIPDRTKSMSVCVTREWFDQSGWQRQTVN